MDSERIELHRLCGLKERPTGGLKWHETLVTGLPVKAIHRLASVLEVPPETLAALVGVDEALLEHREALLNRDASSFIYRIATAFTRMTARTGHDSQTVALWLRNEQADLKKHIPILLLQSHPGTEYVMVCIDRMESPKDKLLAQDTAPDVGVGEEVGHKFDGDDEEDDEDNPFARLAGMGD